MMHIYIPTYRRVDKQKTWSGLPADIRQRTTLVCVAEEAQALRRATGARVLVQPPHIKTISAKRQWIVDQCDAEKLVMLDDDLRFCARDPVRGMGRLEGKDVVGGGVYLPTSSMKDVQTMFGELEDQLDDYAHAGISMRSGNQSRFPGWHENKRMIYVLAYDVERLRRFARFDSIAHREDMWVTLKLLTAGFSNSVSYKYAIDSHYNKAGGEASAGRTVHASNLDAQRLADEFPKYVRAVEKTYKSIPRVEVVVQWSKAWQHHLS